jgi:signal transduction histidine kinase
MRELVWPPLGPVLRAWFTRRTWAEIAYLVVSLPLAAVAVVAAAPLLLGAPLGVLLIGLPLVAVTLVAARRLGGLQRDLAAALLHERVEPPRPRPRGPGAAAWLNAAVRDPANWRATGYIAAKLPLALVGDYALLLCLLVGFGSLSYPLRWAPGVDADIPLRATTSTRAGSWWVAVLGLVIVLAAPWLVRAAVAADRALLRNLLGRTTMSARVRELQDSRALAVDGSAAQLRRIERDLHDGAQVRLAAVALALGRIQDGLADGRKPDLDRTRALVDDAHHNAKQALTELRQLARGIHPPVLDTGLGAALETLLAATPLPVTLTLDVPDRPSPAIETIAYFCAAELLANAVKHSGADAASVTVTAPRGRLLLTVADGGTGGAALRPGGGLAGLADRVAAVDGELRVDSPAGGPTAVRVDLPARV